MNKLTKDGLTGNSGFLQSNNPNIQCLHISANYVAGKGKVFVEKEHKEWGLVWQRMTMARATKESKKIITCAKCKKPAISLDHYWPYDNQYNYCEKHGRKK